MSVKTINAYSWQAPGGVEGLRFIVVQVGQIIQIIDTSIEPYSDGLIYQEVLPLLQPEDLMSFASVDGNLIVASGSQDVVSYNYVDGNIVKKIGRIKIRDQFGVEDIIDGVDLTQGAGLTKRVLLSEITDAHVYNLRNQTWAVPRPIPRRVVRDSILFFYGRAPSNSDNLLYALAPNPAADQPTIDIYWAENIFENPPGTFRAPMGYFIIDALNRGASRLEEYQKLIAEWPQLGYRTISLPQDVTTKGATCVAEFAGRVFYAGFGNTVVDGDSKSPKMGGYVLYSRLVRNDDDIYSCYQEGDPTAKDVPDLLDTDGGLLRISGANNINYLANLGDALVVFAENGVWLVLGGADYGFTANNNLVTKITERGTKYKNSIVIVDNTAMYWSDDGIYHFKKSELGDWVSENITENTIQSFYLNIPDEAKRYAKGVYDSFDKKVSWVYQNILGEDSPSKELVLDLQLGAFYPNVMESIESGYPKVCSAVVSPPFRVVKEFENVTFNGEQVTNSGVDVQVALLNPVTDGVKEVLYVTAFYEDEGEYTYGFTSYSNRKFVDWEEYDGVGKDAEAVLVTGYMSGSDFARNKQVPYITFHMERTEDGFTTDETGELFPANESSCQVQAQWSWNNSAANGKWGVPFQAYRYKRLYSPSGTADNFDNGESLISTRNKLRGSGKVLSLRISTEPEKDLRLVGWSVTMDMNASV